MIAPRGTIVYAEDPFKRGEAGRPWVIVNTPEMPFHGEQYVVLALSTRTWYEERLPIADDDLLKGGLPEDSSILPWAVSSIDPDDVDVLEQLTDDRQGTGYHTVQLQRQLEAQLRDQDAVLVSDDNRVPARRGRG